MVREEERNAPGDGLCSAACIIMLSERVLVFNVGDGSIRWKREEGGGKKKPRRTTSFKSELCCVKGPAQRSHSVSDESALADSCQIFSSFRTKKHQAAAESAVRRRRHRRSAALALLSGRRSSWSFPDFPARAIIASLIWSRCVAISLWRRLSWH